MRHRPCPVAHLRGCRRNDERDVCRRSRASHAAAVSQQIKRLEEGLARPLFDRDQRRFRPTPTGERLVVQARRLLNLNDEILAGLTDAEADGEVMLGVPHDLLRPLLPPVLRRYRRAAPLHGALPQHDLVPAAGRLRAWRGRSVPDHRTRPPDRLGAAVFGSARLGRGPGRPRLAADAAPGRYGRHHLRLRDPTVDVLRRAGREWRTVCEWSDIGPIQAVCEADTGIGALLRSAIPEGLVAVPPEADLPPLPIFNINAVLPPRGDAGRPAGSWHACCVNHLIGTTLTRRLDAAA